ncbi:DCAF15 [Branchiostoma lanceolatum]|uniref:DCAF15 protein n=1 Tax=Branchiostoma lanceolatum TaxID=7740 RepID=A0A8K0E998_BRALA|nr:DCAF15 [Branchiostoma lanceolatum]
MGTKMAAKLKKSNNIVDRLRLKEIRGSLQPHSRATPVKMFNKTIPDSLVFNLKDLVPLSVLHDGHVFLGFTKDGQFVLSYTQLVESDEYSGYPIYEYRLHWWVLQPVIQEQPRTQEQLTAQEQPETAKRHFKLHKVSQVRLFAEEDIPTDVYLLVCQWPTDPTKVLVHGYSYQSGATTPSSDEKGLCYLTVTAVPPVGPCEDCAQLPQDLDPPEPEDSLSTPVPLRCLRHSFTLHTKYELAPPFPPFHPKVSLKLDGVIVLNTADSLVALSIKTGGEDRDQSIYYGGEDKEQSIHLRGEDRELSIHTVGEGRELSIHTVGEGRELSIHTDRGDREQSIHTGGGGKEPETVSSPVLRVDGKLDSKLQREISAATAICQDQVLSSDHHLEMQNSGSNSSYVFNARACSGNQEHVEDKVGDLCEKCGSDNVKTGVTDKSSTCAADHSSADNLSGAAHPGCLEIFAGANSCNTCINTSNASSSSEGAKCFSTKENKSQSEEIRRSVSVKAFEEIVFSKKVASLPETLKVDTTFHGASTVQIAQKTVYTCTQSTGSTPLDSMDCELSSDMLSDALDSNCRNSTALHIKTPEGHNQPSDLLSAASDSSSWDSTVLHKKIPQVSSDLLSAASDSTTSYSTTVDSRIPEGHAQPSDLLSAASDSTTRYSTTVDSRTPEGHAQPSDLLTAASDSTTRYSTTVDSRTPEGHAQPSDLLSAASDSTTSYSTTVDSRTPEGHAQPSDLLSAASDSSWDSTVMDNNRSPCFTFTRRQYVYSTTDGEDHLDDTGESGSEYQSLLPLEVHGAGYSSMRLCMGEDRESTYYGQPGSVEVQELRMDAEQFICDMARQDADWGNRFVAFTDYDMQIIDVCPDSRQLVVLVLALVRARPHYGNCIPKLYQTSFTAAWDLNTGHYQTRDIQPLQEFDQAQLRKVWNPGRAMCRKMQQRWMIPQGYARGVHVMTNEAVFRGHSLSLLWDSTNCIAIIPGRPGR